MCPGKADKPGTWPGREERRKKKEERRGKRKEERGKDRETSGPGQYRRLSDSQKRKNPSSKARVSRIL